MNFPYKTTETDIKNFWELLNIGGRLFQSIPIEERAREASVKVYFMETSERRLGVIPIMGIKGNSVGIM